MSYTKPLVERERALEEAFFHELNQKLLEEMRARREHDADFEALASHLGLHDASLIEPLLELGVRLENVTALVMAPLVEIAWADRTLDNDERRQLLEDEAELGIRVESAAGRLLEGWLASRPHDRLLDAWAAYASELVRVLPDAERDRLREDVVGRAKRLCSQIEKTFLRGGGPNRAERAVLDRIEAAFAGPGGVTAPPREGGPLDEFVTSLT